MNSTAIHLDVDDYKALLAGTYRRRNSFIVSDQPDYTTRFYTHPIKIDRGDIGNDKALEAAILRKCVGASPYIPKAGEIIRFTECCPHKANPIRTDDDGIVRTLLIVDFYQDTDRGIYQNPALESYITHLNM